MLSYSRDSWRNFVRELSEVSSRGFSRKLLRGSLVDFVGDYFGSSLGIFLRVLQGFVWEILQIFLRGISPWILPAISSRIRLGIVSRISSEIHSAGVFFFVENHPRDSFGNRSEGSLRNSLKNSTGNYFGSWFKHLHRVTYGRFLRDSYASTSKDSFGIFFFFSRIPLEIPPRIPSETPSWISLGISTAVNDLSEIPAGIP